MVARETWVWRLCIKVFFPCYTNTRLHNNKAHLHSSVTHTTLANKQNSIYDTLGQSVSSNVGLGISLTQVAKQNVSLKVIDLCRAPLSFPIKGMIQFTLGVIVRHAWCVRGHWHNDWHHTSPSELWAEWTVNSRRKVVRMSNPTFVSDTMEVAASDHNVQKPWACYWSPAWNRHSPSH